MIIQESQNYNPKTIMETNETLTLETLIKELILADLMHSQLIFGLEALQLAPMDYHFLNLYQLIANWMGFKTDEEMDTFMEIYQSFMYKSTSYPVSQHGLDLKPLAEECYEAIQSRAQNLGLKFNPKKQF
jgi:hypothetical protein